MLKRRVAIENWVTTEYLDIFSSLFQWIISSMKFHKMVRGVVQANVWNKLWFFIFDGNDE